MSRVLKRTTVWLLCIALCLELLPLSALAAVDVTLRFRLGSVSPGSEHVLVSLYRGEAYVMRGVQDGRGVAVAADEFFTTVIDPGEDWETTNRYADIALSKAPLRFQLTQRQRAQWEYDYAFSLGSFGLGAADGALTLAEPADAARYWETGFFRDGAWVSALCFVEDEATVFLALRVGDGEPYFTLTDALSEELLPCELAVREDCVHPVLTRHEGRAASCTAAGTATYWSCADCEAAGRDYRFLDEKGTYPFWDESALTTPALGHADEDEDGVCDRCAQPMPVFTRVTSPSEIRDGMTYLLATEIDGALHLLAPPDNSAPSQWVVPATAAVTADGEGAIPYRAAQSAGALMLRLAQGGGKNGDEPGGKGKGDLEGSDYLYSLLCPDGAMLECDGGRGFFADQYGGYGWRVRQNGSEAAEIIPRMMEDQGGYYLRAIRHDGQVWFAACPPVMRVLSYNTQTQEYEEISMDVYGAALGIDGETPEYPVFLYIMSGQDVERWNYALTQGAAQTDYTAVADAPGFRADTAAQAAVTGLAAAVTDRTAREKIGDYREKTGSSAAHYSLTAYSTLTAVSYDPSDAETGETLRYALTHHLTVTDGQNEPITYALRADELSDASYALTLYSWFDPAQLRVTVSFLMGGEEALTERESSFRKTDDPFFGEGRLTTLPFTSGNGLSSLVSAELPVAVRVNGRAAVEPHEHVFNWDYPDYLSKLVAREDGHYLRCERCDEPVKYGEHTYQTAGFRFEPTDTAVGQYIMRCQHDGCYGTEFYEKHETIDPADWAWVYVVDQYGDAVPQSFGAGGDSHVHSIGGAVNYTVTWYSGANSIRAPDKLDPLYVQGFPALYYDPAKYHTEQPLRCVVRFTEGGRLRYKVPEQLVFDDVTPGQAIRIDVHKRSGRSLTVTGRLPDYMEGWHVTTGYLATMLPEINYFNQVTVRDDLSFTVTAPYAHSELHFSLNNGDPLNWRSRSLVIRSVESLGTFDEENMRVDLGELDFEDHDCCDKLKITVNDDTAANAARAAYRGGTFTLTNETTGETWTGFTKSLPETYAVTAGGSPYDTAGPFTFTLTMREGYSDYFAVGDELTLNCDIWDESYGMDPCAFTLASRTDGDTQGIAPTFFRRGGLVIDDSQVQVSSYRGWWSLIFDAEGNRLTTYAVGTVPLEPGDYTYLAYKKNEYVDLVDNPDAMELLGIPASCYCKRTFTVVRGEYTTVQPSVDGFTDFNPYRNVVVTATVGDNLRTGEAVPIYITYKGFDADYAAALGGYTMTLDIVGRSGGSYQTTLPLVLTNGQYAFWDQSEPLACSVTDITAHHYHYAGLKITARALEGAICVYAAPRGETLYITATSSAENDSHASSCSLAVTVPANEVTVQTPPSFTSEPEGELVYFANLPRNEHGYVARLFRDGVECDWDYVSTIGFGQNSLDYSLGRFGGGTWYHELYMEIFAIVEPDESGGWIGGTVESVWRSPTYHIALNESAKVPQPSKLQIGAFLGGKVRGGNTIDLKKNDRRQSNLTFFPGDFNEDATFPQELTYEYRLTMERAEHLIAGTRKVHMTVYCGEKYAEPIVKHVTLTYNEHTQTFDGTLTLDAGTVRLDDLPYGYSFYYDGPEPSPDSVTATKQVAEQLERRIREMQSAEQPLTVPELLDLDELEEVLAKDDEMEPWEKDAIRLCAAYQNAIHDAMTEFQDEFASYEGAGGTIDWITLLATGDAGENSGFAEILSPVVSEDALISRGYQKAETELGDYYVFCDAGGTGAKSVVYWSEEPTERLHRWVGVSPLPTGSPLAMRAAQADGDALSAESTLLFADRNAMDAAKASLDAYYEDSFIPTLINALSLESTLLEKVVTFAGKLVEPELLVIQANTGTRVQYRNAMIDTLNNRIAEGHVTIDGLEREIADTRQQFYEKYSKFGVKAPTETIHVSQAEGELSELIQMGSKVQETRSKIQALESNVMSDVSELRKVENSGKLWEKLDSICKTAREAKNNIERFARTASPHVANAMGVLCMVLDMYSFSEALKEAERSNRAEAANREVMDSIRRNMLEQARQACVDRDEASRQYAKCYDAYFDYCERSYRYVESTMTRARTKYAMICTDLVAIMASIAAAPSAPVIALGVIGANGISDGVSTALIAWRWSRLQRAEQALTDACIDPLPFKRRSGCDDPSSPNGSPPAPGDGPDYPVPSAPVIDPSGYAYEAVASNRLAGVTATIWYQDAYGEETPWEEAPLYDEVYEQHTGADGRYEWMTPPGKWKVRLSKDGYRDADSVGDPAADSDGWLPVPPPQMNVNIGMTALAAPAVAHVSAASDRVRVAFTQYMTAESAGAVSVTQDGLAVPVNAAFTDLEESPTAEGTFYGRVLELTRTDGGAFSGDNVVVSVSAGAASYAGRALGAYSSGALSVQPMVASLSHVYPNRFVTDYNATEELVVTVRDTQGAAMAGVPVTVTQERGDTLRFEADTVTSDSAGRAVFSATGVASGYDVLTFASDDVRVQMNTRVKPFSTESPRKPAATLSDGQAVEAGTLLKLSCATEGAVIYYTTDDTCPCQEGPNRRQYTEPIPVMDTTLFRIASYTEAGGYSERLNLRVYVSNRPVVEQTESGLSISGCEPDTLLIAGFYDGNGAFLRAEQLPVAAGSAELVWTDAPADVRLFFLDPNRHPVCPAWTDYRAD